MVVEGVRHLDVLEALSELLPDLVVAYLTAPPEVLDERWALRGTTDPRDVATRHQVERELYLLRDRASIVIDTARISARTAADVIGLVARSEPQPN